MSAQGVVQLSIAPEHPAFAGHFPGNPIVPGVVLLDEALHAIAAQTGMALSACDITNIKFLSPVRPGEPLRASYSVGDNGTVRFDILSADRKVASAGARAGA